MKVCTPVLATLFAVTSVLAVAQDAPVKTMFKVKYVAEGAVYLDGGRSAGLAEGMKLTIKRASTQATETGEGEASGTWIVAELAVATVAEGSAVCDVRTANRQIQAGDVAYLHPEEVEALVQQRALGNSRAYPAVITFTEGDPLDEEVRAAVPKPPLPEVNRARGRIGVDYNALSSRGSSSSYSQLGFVFRADITRISGTYWNLSGYYRGRMTRRNSSSTPDTVQDVINRTYHLQLTYENPNSRWVAGAGRLYLPWASSLDTIDGGYFGRKLSKRATVGIFAGSTPDPSSWNYNPDRQIAGTFFAFETGSFDNVKYTSSFGVGVSSLKWRIDRPFFFAENGIFYKHYLSLYHSMQADRPRSADGKSRLNAGLSRSFLTIRWQPERHVAFDLSHTYFRDVPTYDPQLIATGLVDKYLFQGISGGARVELPWHVSAYTNIGSNKRTNDERRSWNTLYGVTIGRLWRTGFRVDGRYSQFDSSFGSGWYKSVSLSRNFSDYLRWDTQIGKQQFRSPLTTDDGSRFVNTMLDISAGSNYFMECGFTLQSGRLQDYQQWYTTIGYRFDNRRHSK